MKCRHLMVGPVSVGLTLALAMPCRASSTPASPSTLGAPIPKPAIAPQAPSTETKFIPLPIYSTNPNEGSTFGFMSVFLQVRPDQTVGSIYAPSVSWNDVIKGTGTFRWYHYPSDHENLTVILSASTYTNWNTWFAWQDLARTDGAFTNEVYFRTERSIFYRYFGIGPDTAPPAQSSCTRLHEYVIARRGYNLTENLNLGIAVNLANDVVQGIGIPGLPLTTQAFSQAPGLQGSTISGEFIDLRYDTRPVLEYSQQGLYADFQAGLIQGLWGAPAFSQMQLEARKLFPETQRIQGAARVLWKYVGSKDAPFYDQTSLGGSNLMRGYMQDRFIDQGGWTTELEQRIRLFRTHIYGVAADWRIDPFLAIGQVYDNASSFFSDTRVATGLGFRAFVQPNILGRVDVAYASEGLNIYVELGYPF